MATEFSWGYNNGTSEAPYYLVFSCYSYPRTSKERANLSNPVARIILPGVKVNRGTAHRYSEDAPMMENLSQALGTIDSKLDPANLANMDFGELLGAVSETLSGVSERYQGDAFGQISSNLGRLELLTTEAGYLGSSKRKYSFNWNLKSTSREANTFIAKDIGEAFETLSMPVVGGFAGEGNIAQASRMRPPNVWTITAVNEFGGNEAQTTNLWLGTPKICVLMSVLHGLDNQSFVDDVGGPFSYFLSCNFVELENVFNYNGFITSRSEFFNQLGGG
tara:strand:+ start:434 stop:1264 length:831 start_codon:yes stop_codon:yes gene_type:complete